MEPIQSDIVERMQANICECMRSSSAEQRGHLEELLAFLGLVRTHLTGLGELQNRIAEQQRELARLAESPLQFGVYLGKVLAPPEESTESDPVCGFWNELRILLEEVEQGAAESQRDQSRTLLNRLDQVRASIATRVQRGMIVGLNGQRYEVSLATDEAAAAGLSQGQEVALNKEMNIVGIRDRFERGQTAEVINILSPSGAAEVLAMDGQQLQVKLNDGSAKFEVTVEPGLAGSLHVGDVVGLDRERRRAVSRVKPRLHVRPSGSEAVVVEMIDRLFEEPIAIGDLVRVDTRLLFAFEKLPSYEVGGLSLEEVPDVSYDDIGGLKGEIEKIRDVVELPYIHRKIYADFQLSRRKGILLYGPPGCGKTMIAKAVANSLTHSIRHHYASMINRINRYCELLESHTSGTEGAGTAPDVTKGNELVRLERELRDYDVEPSDARNALRRLRDVYERADGIRSFFLNVKGPELLDKYVGETEHRIRKVFAEAKRKARFHTPVIIFFDEMEAMFRTRGTGRSSDVETTIVPQFLAEMDGVESTENVVIIGASNRQDMIDPAILRPGRLDVKIKVDRPNRDAAMRILALHLSPDLQLSDEEMSAESDASPMLTFPAHIVRRTIRSLGRELDPEDLKRLLAQIPDSQDARRIEADQTLLERLRATSEAWSTVIRQASIRERRAESMIVATVEQLFHPSSRLAVVTSSGRHHSLPLHEFVSGAVLGSIVIRAKQLAVKRLTGSNPAPVGLSLADLLAGIRDEFAENAEQLATKRLEHELGPVFGQPADVVQIAEVRLGEKIDDPWSLEKVPVYRLKKASR